MASTTQTKYGPIGTFLQKVSQNWGLSFVFTKIWAVKFDKYETHNDTNLAQNILTVLESYDDTNNFKNFITNTAKNGQSLYYNLLNFTDEKTIGVKVGKEMHFALANKITLPEESMQINQVNSYKLDAKGGIIQGRLGGGRYDSPTRTVDITFLDTNKEFYEYIIKPWIVASAHRGLIECDDKGLPNLKCNIITSYFAKSSSKNKIKNAKLYSTANVPISLGMAASFQQPMTWAQKTKETTVSTPTETEPYLRKRITFHGCFPISIPSKSYNYSGEMGVDETMTTVRFSYEYYSVEDTTDIQDGLNEKPEKIITMTTEGANSLKPNTEGEGGLMVSPDSILVGTRLGFAEFVRENYNDIWESIR